MKVANDFFLTSFTHLIASHHNSKEQEELADMAYSARLCIRCLQHTDRSIVVLDTIWTNILEMPWDGAHCRKEITSSGMVGVALYYKQTSVLVLDVDRSLLPLDEQEADESVLVKMHVSVK